MGTGDPFASFSDSGFLSPFNLPRLDRTHSVFKTYFLCDQKIEIKKYFGNFVYFFI